MSITVLLDQQKVELLWRAHLFGHEKGAFPGADKKSAGLIEKAKNGTLNIGSIEAIPLSVQNELTQVLKNKVFTRVGGSKKIRTNARFIFEITGKAEDLIDAGVLSRGLYEELKDDSITIPSLRERKADIPKLAFYFIHQFSRQQSKAISHITKEAMDLLVDYSWPENIRELENTLQMAVSICSSGVIECDDIRAAHRHIKNPMLHDQM